MVDLARMQSAECFQRPTVVASNSHTPSDNSSRARRRDPRRFLEKTLRFTPPACRLSGAIDGTAAGRLKTAARLGGASDYLTNRTPLALPHETRR